MSKLDEAMLKHMKRLVINEGIYFWYKDFLNFEVDGIWYKMTHGTFRNKICAFKKKGFIKVAYYDAQAFYTLKGEKLPKKMTVYRKGVRENHFLNILEDLPYDKQGIHDIRLKFKVPGLWNFLSNNTDFTKVKRSKDIQIPTWKDDNAIVWYTIHKTDVISLIVSCSLRPFPLDFDGIIRFFNVLVRAEEKLKNIVHNIENKSKGEKYNMIPGYRTWVVTMWHFGRDSLTNVHGETFSITVESAQGILTRMYSKEINKWTRKVRIERQEYPRKPIEEAITDKLFLLEK